MRTITNEELTQILENHQHWIEEDCEGWEEMLANLSGANLFGADLSGANLFRADLFRADLSGANLFGANLSRAENVPFIPYSCPDFGMFIGYKKIKSVSGWAVIAELEIPEDAKRLSATGRKCRCDKAKVLRFLDFKRNPVDEPFGCSFKDPTFIYTPGKTVYADSFDENRWNECSHGIHFFINFQEAVNYEC